ncbi:MAG: RNA polymerase sigma-70 factor [Bacteroidetes bacterium]|nr:RNA polymerase sigma-70 factor [Bacteroidota bacterium]
MAAPERHTGLDKPAFEGLFRSHFDHLCRFATQYVSDTDTAQDLCQKVFIRLWEKREEMDPKQSIKSYLFTSVKNRCLNYLRDQKKYRSQVLDLDCGDIEFGYEDEEAFAEADLKDRIEKALSSLPEKCRLVFEMSRFQDLKYKEIATELDISQKTVEAHMSKALKSLRSELQDYLILVLMIGLWLLIK